MIVNCKLHFKDYQSYICDSFLEKYSTIFYFCVFDEVCYWIVQLNVQSSNSMF